MKLLSWLLEEIHTWCGRETEYKSLQLYRKGEISLEHFAGTYVREWSSDCSSRTMQGLVKFIRCQSIFWRNAAVLRTLSHYELQRALPWLLKDNSHELCMAAQTCFAYQLPNPSLVVNVFEQMLQNGMNLSRFMSAHEDLVDPGIVFCNEILGEPTYSWNVYLFRACTAMKATFLRESLPLTRDDDVFFYESRGSGHFWSYNEVTGTREIIKQVLEQLLYPFVTGRTSADSLTSDTVSREARRVLSGQNDHFNKLRKELKVWRMMFRAVTDPYVSENEMFMYLRLAGIPDVDFQVMWHVYRELCPGLYTNFQVPRSLKHLSRQCIRRTLYDNWRYPDDVYKITADSETLEYLALKCD